MRARGLGASKTGNARKGSWAPQGYACCACTCTGYTWSMHGLCMCTRVCARAHARAPQVLSVLLERPHFFYQREMTVFLKLTFFQVFNVLFCMVTMLYRDGIDGFVAAGDQTTRGWLANAAPLLVNVLLGDMVVINIGIDCGRPDVFIMRNFIAPRCKTQSKMNRAYIVDADVYLAFRLQLVAKVTLGARASTRPRACVWGVWVCTHACMRAPSRDLPLVVPTAGHTAHADVLLGDAAPPRVCQHVLLHCALGGHAPPCTHPRTLACVRMPPSGCANQHAHLTMWCVCACSLLHHRRSTSAFSSMYSASRRTLRACG